MGSGFFYFNRNRPLRTESSGHAIQPVPLGVMNGPDDEDDDDYKVPVCCRWAMWRMWGVLKPSEIKIDASSEGTDTSTGNVYMEQKSPLQLGCWCDGVSLSVCYCLPVNR